MFVLGIGNIYVDEVLWCVWLYGVCFIEMLCWVDVCWVFDVVVEVMGEVFG